LGKSVKKIKKQDEYEDKVHHIFKKQKTAAVQKQSKKMDRVINNAIKHNDPRSLYNEYDLENYA
jgi:hypothetical protein